MDPHQQQQEWQMRHDEVVAALTAAARTERAPGEAMDFADFLASVTTSVAANLGSLDRLIAGRPGSWEADLVYNLALGTAGDHPEGLYPYRTEPVIVPLNVRELVAESMGWEATLDGVENALFNSVPTIQGIGADGAVVEYADDAAIDAQNAAFEAAKAKITRAYARYGEAFTAAVQAKAATIKGLTVPVTVRVEADPDTFSAEVRNPEEWALNTDPLVLQLWTHARDSLPAPTADFGTEHTGET